MATWIRTWLFFLLLSTNGKSKSTCPEKATLSGAVHCCENLTGNQYLPTIQSHEDKISAGTFIGEGETWVNLKLHVNREWKITGNRSIAHTFTKPGWKYRDSHCGIMKKKKSHITLVPCSTQGLGSLCEIQNCDSCMSLGRLAHNCFNLEKRCYVVYCGLGNWFDARAMCRRYGMDLAPPDENILREFTNTRMPSIRGLCRNTWVGLYRDTWDQIKALASAHVTIPLWAPGQPSNTGSCAILRWLDEGYYLMSANCTERHEYICQVYPAMEAKIPTTKSMDILIEVYNSTSQMIWTGSMTPPSQNETLSTTRTFIYIIPPFFIIILIVAVVACVIWCRIKRNRRSRNDKGNGRSGNERGNEEETAYINDPNEEESGLKDEQELDTIIHKTEASSAGEKEIEEGNERGTKLETT